jgi:hypothetical protein
VASVGEVGPVDLGPVDLTRIDVEPADVTPAEVGPVDVGRVDATPVEATAVRVTPVEVESVPSLVDPPQPATNRAAATTPVTTQRVLDRSPATVVISGLRPTGAR